MFNGRTIECVTLRIAEKGAHNERFNSIEYTYNVLNTLVLTEYQQFDTIFIFIFSFNNVIHQHIIRSRRGENTLIYYKASSANSLLLVRRMCFVIHGFQIRIENSRSCTSAKDHKSISIFQKPTNYKDFQRNKPFQSYNWLSGKSLWTNSSFHTYYYYYVLLLLKLVMLSRGCLWLISYQQNYIYTLKDENRFDL